MPIRSPFRPIPVFRPWRRAALLCALGIAAAAGQDAPRPPALSGEDIMRVARNSLYRQDTEMRGRLRPGGISFQHVPFRVSVFEGEIKFGFYEDDNSKNPINQVISLNLKNNRYELREIVKGRNKELPMDRYGEKIRGTDVTYEDIAMRFLYWPDPVRRADEEEAGRATWVVDAANPLDSGPYRKVRVWVDQQSGAALKIEGYDGKGRLKKRFRVRGVQRDGDGGWVPETVRVEAFDPRSGDSIGETVMEFEDPD